MVTGSFTKPNLTLVLHVSFARHAFKNASRGGDGDMLNSLSVRVQRFMSIGHSSKQPLTVLSLSFVTTDSYVTYHI